MKSVQICTHVAPNPHYKTAAFRRTAMLTQVLPIELGQLVNQEKHR